MRRVKLILLVVVIDVQDRLHPTLFRDFVYVYGEQGRPDEEKDEQG